MQTLAQSVFAYVHQHALLQAGDRVGAAVSGGADSVALLRLLLELRHEIGIVLSVVHFNHQLRSAESDGDEHFVAELARRHDLQFHCASGEVARHAAERRLSIETAARELRYAYFTRLLGEDSVNRIATGHTLDDQAETVLMRMVRGSGTRGLAGIHPRLSVRGSQFTGQTEGLISQTIIRPLLGVRRGDLEAYLRVLSQEWREDSSNVDLRHARNRVRHGILQALERDLNPAVREALADTAEIARAEEEYWQQAVERALPECWESSRRHLHRAVLRDLPLALQRRVIRAAAESLGLRLEFGQVEDIREVCSGKAKSAALPGGWRAVLYKKEVEFANHQGEKQTIGYEYRIQVPGEALLPEAGSRLETVVISGEDNAGYDGKDLLDPAAVSTELVARNWRAGDRFWPAHTREAKKIKELLQEKHVTGAERAAWPVLVSGSEIVWVRGLATPKHLRPARGGKRC